MVDTYLADKGVLKSNWFVQNIGDHNQHICYFGVNVHNKNGESKRSIRTVSEMSRSMMLY